MISAAQMPVKDNDLPPAVQLAGLLAECAGLIHDFGKYGEIFQDKLNSPVPKADPVRHEWISLRVLLSMLDGGTWEMGWASGLRMPEYLKYPKYGFKNGLQSVESVLAFLVMSHHRLPRGQLAKDGKSRTRMAGDDEYFRADASRENRPNPFVDKPTSLALSRLEELLARVRGFELPDKSPEAMRAIASLARMALILADHAVSGVDKTADADHGASISAIVGAAFANTQKRDGINVKNQELGWHLSHVGTQAGAMPQRMLEFAPPGLSKNAIEGLR